jgi:Bacterial sugar transferase
MTLVGDQVDPRPARSAAADPSDRLRSLDTALTQHETREAVRERTPDIPERRRGTASLSGPGVLIHSVEGVPLVGVRPLRLSRSSRVLERTADLVLSGVGLVLKIPDDPRVTSVGRFLRRYSLDELPQLLNVFTGEMSLVGPRPLVLDEDKHVPDWARKRLDLRPGITGLWQVLGRSEIPFEEMTKLDYLYVTNWTLWRDVQLLFRTIPAVFRPRRAY